MDELTVAGKIMDSAMNENMHDEASETGVEGMLSNLKQEIAMEINSGLANDPSKNYHLLKELCFNLQ